MSALADELRVVVREVLREELPRLLTAHLQARAPAPRSDARLSVADAARVAHRHPDTIRRAIKTHALHATKPAGGREWIIDQAEIERWRNGPASTPLDMQAEVEKALARIRGT